MKQWTANIKILNQKGGAYTREKFLEKSQATKDMVKGLSDQEIENLNRGGHDPLKVFNAYNKAHKAKASHQ